MLKFFYVNSLKKGKRLKEKNFAMKTAITKILYKIIINHLLITFRFEF